MANDDAAELQRSCSAPPSQPLSPPSSTVIPTVGKNKPSESRGKEELHVLYSQGTWQTMSNENATGNWTFEFQVRYATTGQINDNKLLKFLLKAGRRCLENGRGAKNEQELKKKTVCLLYSCAQITILGLPLLIMLFYICILNFKYI